MSVFAVVLDAQNPQAVERIQEKYPEHLKLNDTLFLVNSNAIAEKVAHAVGIKGEEDERIQSGVVFRLNHSYSGYTSRALWDWLEKVEAEQ